MKNRDRLLAALDLGSSKILALVAESDDGGRIALRGAGLAESKGFRRDSLVHLQSAVEAIGQAMQAAEQAAGVNVESVVVGVAGAHIKSLNSRGGITLGPRPREVEAEDVRRAIEAARAVSLPPEQELLHVLPQEFLLDQQNGIRDPLGLLGRRLEVNVHIVTANSTAAQNLVSAVNRAGLLVEDTLMEPLAAAESCLSPDERELGVVLADVGAGSTDWIVFHHGAPRASGMVPVGGEHFTNDIAIGLRTPLFEAERLKRAYGCASLRWVAQDSLLEVASIGERPDRVASRRALVDIIEPRAQEWLALLREALDRSECGPEASGLPPAGLVLTGGAAQLEGLVDYSSQLLQVPVRLGLPKGLLGAGSTLANPANTAGVGLLLHCERLRQARRRQNGGLFDRLRSLLGGKGWAA
jgi:cell division protein FtsA